MTAKTILVTGGAGFIGSHLVRHLVSKYPQYQIINLDKLTYAGNLENLRDVERFPNYKFIKGDITHSDFIETLFENHKITDVIHLAAESHVDRSITSPMDFVMTNVVGTVVLLNAFKKFCKREDAVFYHVSTDEVYGQLTLEDNKFTEKTSYDPSSPYSASKASSDHFVRAYSHTYKINVKLSNCSNNYGSHQFPEKLIPLFIHNIKNNIQLPVYGKGENVRDWLWVADHSSAIDLIFHKGKVGDTYNVGGNNEWKNIDLIKLMCSLMDQKTGKQEGSSEKLITYVQDRSGHDFRYAIDSSKLMNELGWKPSVTFEQGLSMTIDWYLANDIWLNHVTSGAYQAYYNKMYQNS